jgi:hypothetical protein
VESLAAFGLAAVNFFGRVLAWQGCAGSIEALSLGDVCQEWKGPLVVRRLCRR